MSLTYRGFCILCSWGSPTPPCVCNDYGRSRHSHPRPPRKRPSYVRQCMATRPHYVIPPLSPSSARRSRPKILEDFVGVVRPHHPCCGPPPKCLRRVRASERACFALAEETTTKEKSQATELIKTRPAEKTKKRTQKRQNNKRTICT